MDKEVRGRVEREAGAVGWIGDEDVVSLENGP
jgi:hypothetical protein